MYANLVFLYGTIVSVSKLFILKNGNYEISFILKTMEDDYKNHEELHNIIVQNLSNEQYSYIKQLLRIGNKVNIEGRIRYGSNLQHDSFKLQKTYNIITNCIY